jgi:hypothetical protein
VGKKRRQDEAHDVGDSMPGTVGDSDGTIHDRRGGPTFNDEEVTVPGESNTQKNNQDTESETNDEETSVDDEDNGQSTRMKYAKRYGDSWPEDRQKNFLQEHNVSASDMRWKLTE